ADVTSFSHTFDADGTFYITVKAVDKVGFTSGLSKEGFVLIDTEKPALEIINLTNDQYITSNTFTLGGLGSDKMAGLDKIEVRIDGGEWYKVESSKVSSIKS
ncbi:MAG: hypothetical protein NTY22_08770, partial [Proteobacteria bacterium]|nr:hypothetical protein [Pseudomonadota bacterium]